MPPPTGIFAMLICGLEVSSLMLDLPIPVYRKFSAARRMIRDKLKA
jgi:hypothetical protein